MLSTKLAVDIVFVALVFLAVSITAVVLVKVLSDISTAGYMAGTSRSEQAAKSGDSALETTDRDSSADSASNAVTDESVDSKQSVPEFAAPDEQLATSIYESWPYILPITWGAVAGTLIWRGKVRSAWSRQGYDYDTFRLVAKMRGSPTRIRLLNAISCPKNKLQLAKELGVDWKTIDNHIEMLLQSGLVEEKGVVGTSKYYVITKNGMKVLSLLSGSEMADKENDDR